MNDFDGVPHSMLGVKDKIFTNAMNAFAAAGLPANKDIADLLACEATQKYRNDLARFISLAKDGSEFD